MKNELLITLQRLRNTVNEGNSYKRILLENASNSKINTLAMEMERKYGVIYAVSNELYQLLLY